MKYTFTALALAALSFANPVPEAAAPAPSSFKITNVISGGSGCPQDSIDIDWTDNKILPIYFGKEFTARVGSGTPPEESRKNCQLNIALKFSPGYQFAVYSTDVSGWADIDSGVKGLVSSNYYFSGETDDTRSSFTVAGPIVGRYSKHDDGLISVWSPCTGSALFNINTEVALTPIGAKGYSILAASKESVRFTSILNFKWRQC